MARYLGIRMLLMVLVVSVNCGCVSWKENRDPYSGHWRLLESERQVLDQKVDRAKLEELAGKPTIDDGEEWVYVSKFTEGKVIPLDMLMAIYATEKPVWKITVVSFGEAGFVSSIRTETARSEISERPAEWTLMGVHMKKNVRERRVPATQAGTTRSSENGSDQAIPSAPVAR